MKTSIIHEGYRIEEFLWDEMYSDEGIRSHYAPFMADIESLNHDDMAKKNDLAKKLFMT